MRVSFAIVGEINVPSINWCNEYRVEKMKHESSSFVATTTGGRSKTVESSNKNKEIPRTLYCTNVMAIYLHL